MRSAPSPDIIAKRPGVAAPWPVAVCAGLILGVVGGCGDEALSMFKTEKKPPPERAPEPTIRDEQKFADTIGSYAYYANDTGLSLQGFGLVYGLGSDGSSDCPTRVREYLTDFLGKELAPAGGVARNSRIDTDKLIDSSDTAVVRITAVSPPGATKGTVFDVRVEALPGTQTRSLEGGILLPCELKVYTAAMSTQGVVESRTLARAEGPLFTNPFTAKGDEDTPITRATGLGCARTLYDRITRLALYQPSYAQSQSIERRLNERFGQRPRTATAQSAGYLEVLTPREFAARPDRFLELALRLYVRNAPAFYHGRIQDMLNGPPSARDWEELSLIIEGIGRTGVQYVQPFYSDPDPAIRFFAARTGLRLRDPSALEVMTAIAADNHHPNRIDAIVELGESGYTQAAERLRDLVNGADQDARIAAYKALLAARNPAVKTLAFRAPINPRYLGFQLDVVESTGEPMIYVRTSREPRIAVFGPNTTIRGPVFLSLRDDWINIASDPSGELTIFSRTRVNRRLSDPIHVPPRVTSLIRAMGALPTGSGPEPRGLGLPYSLIVQ
ncbi:MAG: flagellar basal body P-ring protein FlgI, partial [Phycisphaerales bacterium]|nr:flagellar basal body P-ring protein FlgI [Phycisphaerales bacterium]